MQACMLIAWVLEPTFYYYQTYTKDQQEARNYGNSGLLKLGTHNQQAIVILKCIFDKKANHMPYKNHTLKSRKKVVSMILLVAF